MFPPRMLFAGGLSDATQWGIISCQCSTTKRGANLHLKWHIVVGLGTNRGQKKRGGFFEYRKTRAVFYLFVLIVPSVLSNHLYYSHWWTPLGFWNVLLFWAVFLGGFFQTLPKSLRDCLCLAVTSKCCNSMKFSMQFLIRGKQQLFWPFTERHHRLRNVFNWTPSKVYYATSPQRGKYWFSDWHKGAGAATDVVHNIQVILLDFNVYLEF